MDLLKPKIHKNTTNKSFLDMHYLLKEKGVKNNLFFLVIYNERLMNIDPFSDNLTPQDKLEIEIEVRMNPWYFFREICIIPESGGQTRFQLHLGNLALIFLCLQNFNVIEVLPRQHGKSHSTVAMIGYIYRFLTTNSEIVFGNKKLDDAKLNLTRYKEHTLKLPKYLIKESKGDQNNQFYIKSEITNNSIKIIGTATDEEGADKLGRGLNVPILWLDEFAFIKYVYKIFMSAAPATSEARIRAETNGVPSFIVLTTTPNNMDIPEGKFALDKIGGALRFTLDMFDKSTEVLKDMLKYNSNTFFYVEFSYVELGRTEDWFREQCQLIGDEKTIKREILLDWPNTTDNSVFTEEQISELYKHANNIITTRIIKEKYVFNFVNVYDLMKPYILGIDVAGGLSLDASTIVVVDPTTLEPIGYFHNNTIGGPEFLSLIEELVNMYFPTSCIAIEYSPLTMLFLQDMIKNTNLKSKMIYHYTDDATKEKERSLKNINIEDSANINKRYGIPINRITRPIMLDILQYEVYNNPSCFRIKDLIKEISVLERDKTGKIGAAQGMHDDLIFAYLYARYALSNIPHINRFIKYANNNTINTMNKIRNISNNFKAYNHFENVIGREVNPNKKESFLQKIIALNNYK